MTTVERETKRTYIVEDYCGVVRRCDKLKDAREYLYQLGHERFARIKAETVETIVIKTEQVIQTL